MINIYTKEMHEAGELPKVGMRIYVAVRGDLLAFSEVEIISMSADNNPVITFLRDSNCECMYWHSGRFFKPIDTRTDREKAIDDLANAINNYYDNDNKSFEEDANELLNYIKAGKIHGITFIGAK